MRRLLLLIAVLAGGAAGHGTPAAAATPGPCTPGSLPTGAQTLICVPGAGWNGGLVLYAHGYVDPGEPLEVRHLELPGGGAARVADLVQAAGYAFATTSYRSNGLVVADGVEDLRDLRAAFIAAHGPPAQVLAAGVSEGGLVVTLLAERHPLELAGALEVCGPVGSMRGQLDYVGDLRVLFDHWFPGVLPGSVVDVPERLARRWHRVYEPRVRAAVRRRPGRARKVVRVARAATDPGDRATVADTIAGVLRYGAVATNDVVARLGGSPYDNRGRRYRGSGADRRLNRVLPRHRASRTALRALAAYEPAGNLAIPIVGLHTTGDEIVPFRQATAYARRAGAAFTLRRLDRYGHCAITATDVLGAFGALTAATAAR